MVQMNLILFGMMLLYCLSVPFILILVSFISRLPKEDSKRTTAYFVSGFVLGLIVYAGFAFVVVYTARKYEGQPAARKFWIPAAIMYKVMVGFLLFLTDVLHNRKCTLPSAGLMSEVAVMLAVLNVIILMMFLFLNDYKMDFFGDIAKQVRKLGATSVFNMSKGREMYEMITRLYDVCDKYSKQASGVTSSGAQPQVSGGGGAAPPGPPPGSPPPPQMYLNFDNNSCYLDSTLMALFHGNSEWIHRNILEKNMNSVHLGNTQLRGIAHKIQNELKAIFYGTTSKCTKLRALFDEFYKTSGTKFKGENEVEFTKSQLEPIDVVTILSSVFVIPDDIDAKLNSDGSERKVPFSLTGIDPQKAKVVDITKIDDNLMFVNAEFVCVHIMRNKNGTKLTNSVTFPERIDLQNNSLNLQSIILHVGNGANSGHYTCLIKKSNGWYLYDDMGSKLTYKGDFSKVVSDDYVLQNCTMLVYHNDDKPTQRLGPLPDMENITRITNVLIKTITDLIIRNPSTILQELLEELKRAFGEMTMVYGRYSNDGTQFRKSIEQASSTMDVLNIQNIQPKELQAMYTECIDKLNAIEDLIQEVTKVTSSLTTPEHDKVTKDLSQLIEILQSHKHVYTNMLRVVDYILSMSLDQLVELLPNSDGKTSLSGHIQNIQARMQKMKDNKLYDTILFLIQNKQENIETFVKGIKNHQEILEAKELLAAYYDEFYNDVQLALKVIKDTNYSDKDTTYNNLLQLLNEALNQEIKDIQGTLLFANELLKLLGPQQ